MLDRMLTFRSCGLQVDDVTGEVGNAYCCRSDTGRGETRNTFGVKRWRHSLGEMLKTVRVKRS